VQQVPIPPLAEILGHPLGEDLRRRYVGLIDENNVCHELSGSP
jgi:hypothetical protein